MMNPILPIQRFIPDAKARQLVRWSSVAGAAEKRVFRLESF